MSHIAELHQNLSRGRGSNPSVLARGIRDGFFQRPALAGFLPLMAIGGLFMKHRGRVGAVVAMLGLGTTLQPAGADTLLIPAISMLSPNIFTIVSVNNRPGNASSHLALVYRTKAALASDASPNTNGSCDTTKVVRPTSDGDLVSFDLSGTLNGGNALFGDTNNYGGVFSLSTSAVTTATRGYLLVSNSDSNGNRVDTGNARDLGGEFINLDVSSGAAWGGKAINDKGREDYSFVNAASSGGVYAALPSNDYLDRRFNFFPPQEWSTRFYVTPIGNAMDSAQLSATVQLSNTDLYDRNGGKHIFTAIPKTVVCTGALDLKDMMDSSSWSAVENLGGWTWFQVTSGSAVVYKLEYSSASTYGGTVNNGYLLSDYNLP